jgi:parallel beta-helix repeat protein
MGGIRVRGRGGPVDTTIANNVIEGQGRYDSSGFIRTPSVGQHTITGNTITNLGTSGVFAIGVESGPSIVSNNVVSGGGVYLFTGSHECTGNIISDTTYGLIMGYVEDSCITDNTFSLNDYGIYIQGGEDNWVYNNNFIDNEIQALVTDSSGNVFNLPSPIGGNYWSDWTSPDSDGDGIVDLPYAFDGGQDNLPWVVQDGWKPQTMIGQLSSDVLALNLQPGVETSLTSLLNAAQQALDDPNASNNVAAINALGAFINAVEALSGIQIPETDANALIAAAQQIIDLLNAT